MKTILITIAIILISFSANALEPTTIRFKFSHNAVVRTICVNDYVFVVVKTDGSNGISITQMFEAGRDSGNRPAQPVKCKKIIDK